MRLYLGEIKTPFNKQRLIERLGAFLLNADTQRIIRESLDNLDVLILTAVSILPETSRTALLLFLSSEVALQTRLTNLEQRLVLYCTHDADDEEAIRKSYRINPLLYHTLEPLLDSRILFAPRQKAALKSESLLCDDIVLAGIYSFFLKEPDVFKVDGSFKLKIEKQLKTIFEDLVENVSGFRMLCKGLQNLGLLMQAKTGVIPQRARWEEFFKQNPFDRKMYSAAAVYDRARRDTLYRRAQFFSDFLLSLDPCGQYDDTALHRIFCFRYQRLHSETDSAPPIFAHMSSDVLQHSIDTLKTFRFLLPVGAYWQLNSEALRQEVVEQPLVIAPSFELTLLPFTSLKQFFPVFNCVEPVSILTVGRFTLTRAACVRCFEQGYTDTDLISLLNKAVAAPIPQNITVSISEWYLQSTVVSLYHGFVITAAEDKRKLFMQNAALQSIISKELASGVYLVKQMNEDAVRAILKSAGLDVTCYSGGSTAYYTAAELPAIEQRSSSGNDYDTASAEKPPPQYIKRSDYRKHMQALQAYADTLPIDAYSKCSLKEKIEHKLILTAEQLRSVSVDSEVQEVSGIDFLGKVHLAESAIADQNRLEVSIKGRHGLHVLIGIPLALEKTAGDALLVIEELKTRYEHKISIASIVKMKVFRNSFF